MTTPISQSYREIPLTKGQIALVDESDYGWLMQWKWCATFNPTNRQWYALRSIRIGKKTISFRMARELAGIPRGDKRQVDHANHNTLDNRRFNLRICTPAQNQHNTRGHSNGKSGYKGVFFDSSHGKCVAKIMVSGKKYHLGYGTAEECAILYRDAARRLHGEFTCLETNSLTRCAKINT